MGFIKTRSMSFGTAFLCFCMCILFASAIRVGKPSAYDVLKSYNLPIGILPQNVNDYDLDPATGRFSVHISSTCDSKIDQYEIQYNSTIEGLIQQNQIAELTGVQAKVALLLINVNKVNRNNDQIEFHIGDFLTKDIPIGEFDKSPQCN